MEVQSNMLRSGGMDTLAQMIYSKELVLADLPTSGVFSLPRMWSFEQRMTIQSFSHLIELKAERRNVPRLTELLKDVRVLLLQSLELVHAPFIRVVKGAESRYDDLSV